MVLMEWDLDVTIGKIHRFWWWCVDYCESGDLRKHNDGRIAQAMGVAIPESKRLVDAMVKACWLDRSPYFRVHDWWDYAGRYLQGRYSKCPEKWQKIRDLYQVDGNHTETIQIPDSPNLTKPDQTKPNQTKPKDKDMRQRRSVFVRPSVENIAAYCRQRGNRIDAQQFFDYYESNGWRVGKNHMKDWMATVRTWEKNNFERGGNYVNGTGRPSTLHDRLLEREPKPNGQRLENMPSMPGGVVFPKAMPILK